MSVYHCGTYRPRIEDVGVGTDENRISEMAMLMDGHLTKPTTASGTASISALAAPTKRARALDPITESGTDYDSSKRVRLAE